VYQGTCEKAGISIGLGESRGHKCHLLWEHPGGESWSPDNRQKSLKADGHCMGDSCKPSSECLAEGIQVRATAVLQTYRLTTEQEQEIFLHPLLGGPKPSITPLHFVF